MHHVEKNRQDSRQKSSEPGSVIRQVTWFGMIVNFCLCAAKFLAGYFGNSKALMADGVHSLSDVTTDIAVIVGSYFWLKPPDDDHPYGHRRIETMVTLLIGVALAGVGVFLTLDAIETLRMGVVKKPQWIVVAMAAVSILSKEGLYRWTLVQSRKIRSSALAANAWHHRSDAISSIPVLITVAIVIVRPEWSFLDPLGAAVVSGFILKASVDIIRPGLSELLDGGVDPKLVEQIKDVALKTPGVLDVHDFRARLVGSQVQADMHVVLPPSMTIADGHRIVEEVMEHINQEVPEVIDVLIHLDPWDDRTIPDSEKNYPPPI